MNIFFIDYTVSDIAQQLVDKHVLVGIKEVAQMLCTAHYLRNTPPYLTPPYKTTHKNHPVTKWVAANPYNYTWTVSFGLALAREYTHRWGKTHKSQQVVEWCQRVPNTWIFDDEEPCDWFDLTPPIVTKDWQWVNRDWNASNVRYMYRCYYVLKKAHLFKWTNRPQPAWTTELCPSCGRPCDGLCGYCSYQQLMEKMTTHDNH